MQTRDKALAIFYARVRYLRVHASRAGVGDKTMTLYQIWRKTSEVGDDLLTSIKKEACALLARGAQICYIISAQHRITNDDLNTRNTQ